MGKIKDYLSKPYTRGDVLKQTLFSAGLTAAVWGGLYVYGLYVDRNDYKEKYYKEIGLLPTEESEEIVD